MQVDTRAIVIKKNKASGADLLLTIYSRELGKKKLYVRGARHPKSRFLPVGQILVEGDFSLYLKPSLSSINSVTIVDSHPSLREDYEKFFVASFMLELIDKVTEESDRDENLYEFLSFALKFLEMETKERLKFFRLVYTIKLLKKTGYSPELSLCSSCQGTDHLAFFSASSGGRLCTDCRKLVHDARTFSDKALEFFSLSLCDTYIHIRKHYEKDYDLNELSLIVEDFLNEHILGRSLKTYTMLKDMNL